MYLKDTPIQRKLMGIILLTCSVTLLLMCAAYIALEFLTYRKNIKNSTTILSTVIASNSSAALAFDSPEDASEILNALRADENITQACLYNASGKVFAVYPHGSKPSAFPARVEEDGFRFEHSHLVGFVPVLQNNQRLGTLYIKSSLKLMNEQLDRYVLIAFLLIAMALFVAYLLSEFFQRSISKPILALQRTSQLISQNHDYTVRVEKLGNDELGALTDSFNQMLSQIERQNSELVAAQEESSKLAAVVESSGDAIISNNLDLRVTNWNRSAERLFGYEAPEMLGRPVFGLIPSYRWEEDRKLFRRLLKEGNVEPFETQFIAKNRGLLDVSLTISRINDALGTVIGISIIARDISRQKKNEQLLIEQEEHFRLATSAAGIGTYDFDVVNNSLVLDARCRELLGYSLTAQVSYGQFLEHLHPEDKERVSQVVKKSFNYEESKGVFDEEYRVSGDNPRWIRARGKVFFDEHKHPVRFIGALIDVTDKKQEEIRKNDFIAIISHELKTPLTSIKSYVQILLGKVKQSGDDFMINALSRAEHQANRMTSMIHDFLSLARIEEGKLRLSKASFELKPLLDDVLNEARLLSSVHPLQLNMPKNVHVYADREKISQVLINLMSNAIKYSPGLTSITLGCELEGKQARVYVKDEGVGISQEDQRKLFDRFYRVKNEKIKTVSGFGIGLYIVSEILRLHESKIEVNSTEGKGAEFWFKLPCQFEVQLKDTADLVNEE